MSYQVLARKWRPHSFAELVGQEHIVQALGNALDNDRLHHAYLFTGTRGVGKTTLARIVAKALNCERGVSSTPCGECSACREIDSGRFVDLLEVDAASRTKVDQTRELLEQVPFAPVAGRYKVYLIDEVHMFSDSSFNALLKTLEEPPPHVKFLLATTDPQKVPATVLSRCLQFSLKRLPIEQIRGQFERILEAEGVAAEAPALGVLARAADGSMRDGLSLLDQAIAYGGGSVKHADVQAMLGTLALDRLPDLLLAVHAGDGATVLDMIGDLAEQAPDFAELLRELILLVHRAALINAVPDALQEAWGNPGRIQELAQQINAEDLQLYYQIGLLGQRDLPLAPDPRSGFEMVLLRMLAFRPGDADQQPGEAAVATRQPRGRSARPAPSTASTQSATSPPGPKVPYPSASKPSASAPQVREETPPAEQGVVDFNDWHALLPRLGLGGMASQLAANCVTASWDGQRLVLNLDPGCSQLCGTLAEERLRDALKRLHGGDLALELRCQEPQDETPAQRLAREKKQQQVSAEQAFSDDPFVQALEQGADAHAVSGSVRPVNS